MPRLQKGIIAILPMLLIVAAFVLVVSFNKTDFKMGSQVLSESTSGSLEDEEKTPEPEESDNPEEVKELKETPRVRETKKPNENSGRKEVKTPKPSRSPQVSKSPKPSETPEVEEEEDNNFKDKVETEVLEGTREAKIKIKSGDDTFEFEQEGAKINVQSTHPVSVNPETKELSITTPKGTKVVTVLPDTAAENILNSGVLNDIQKDQTGTQDIRIKSADTGEAVYEIRGSKSEKFLGFLKVSIPKSAQVSLESGRIVKIDQSLTSKILDILSI
jgi:outer membrane biosynthesis protein TonB